MDLAVQRQRPHRLESERHPASFTIQDGAIVAHGERAHCFYVGDVGRHNFTNFEVKVDVKAAPNSNGGIFVHTEYLDSGWPAKGFEIQVNNTYNRDPVKTGSLYHVKDVHEALPKDNDGSPSTSSSGPIRSPSM